MEMNVMNDKKAAIKKAENNIRTAIDDYWLHTDPSDIFDNITNDFICRLAEDSVLAKWELRELFRKSPAWNEDIDAIVINGTRTHDPDYERVKWLIEKILYPVYDYSDVVKTRYLDDAMLLFTVPDIDLKEHPEVIDALEHLAPKAYAPGKKLSRIFKALCVQLGIADESSGSAFQCLFAQLADELSTRKIDYKLFVSINPAHFLTMSNPKDDYRGSCMTSCHSLNSMDYEYNNGCSGYARDNVTFIVFTVDDPDNPESLNNRKTSRQIFAYQPGNGVLLQSRMYNTSGGVYGAAKESKEYRDLIQREISALEEKPNLWKTGQYLSDTYRGCLTIGEGFGGYPDWNYSDFDAHISIRTDHAEDWKPLEVGTYGLCLQCGEEISDGLFCPDCYSVSQCECCGSSVGGSLYTVFDRYGNEIEVCEQCFDYYYSYCEICETYHPNEYIYEVDDTYVCEECRDEYFQRCIYCGEYHRVEDMVQVHDAYGGTGYICDHEVCLSHFPICEECGERYYEDEIGFVHLPGGTVRQVCGLCIDNYYCCPHCNSYVTICDDGTCPSCGVVVVERNREEK